ncbi:MAG TPA: acetyl-CoA carboxylase biotin carboxyl carrier protein [Vicinamibacteria bacterium]|nr:acetyl-CoA carboxylase biotin carboxyl carrier protein [Vicinamibacteria bacterium]
MDIADLKEILRILEEQDITEFELEQDGVKLRVCRASSSAPARPLVSAAAPADAAPLAGTLPAPQAAAAPAGPAPEAAPAANGTLIKSPIVGTFYRSPDPNSQPFVAVGDRVKVGQVLCIIEAMKLMNEIEAEIAGEVMKIHVESGQAVQYGDPLFTVRPA